MKLHKIKSLSLVLITSLAITALPAGGLLGDYSYGADNKAAVPSADEITDGITDGTTDEPEIPVEPPLPPEKQEQTITCGTAYGVVFGQTKQVNAKANGGGTITFTSNDPEIFDVTPSGVLIPKKLGKATLTVTASETETHKSAVREVKVTVRSSMAQPEITAKEIIGEEMFLKWARVTGAAKYEIYRKAEGGDYVLIDTISSPYTTSYSTSPKEQGIKQGVIYYYKVRAVAQNENDYIDSLGRSMCWLAEPQGRIGSNAYTVQFNWTKINAATGYYVYRKTAAETTWQQVKKISGGSITSYHDVAAKNDNTYEYAVKAYYGTSLSTQSKAASAYYLAAPASVSWTVASKNSRLLKWSKNQAADGYELQYANNRLFIGASTLTVSNPTTEKVISNLTAEKTAFARVRAYKTKNGKKIYTNWKECQNAGAEGFASINRLENKDKPLELRGLSGQVMGRNDTAQGGCTDGIYAYYCMYDRSKENAKVIKIRIADKKFIKASAVLPIDHGNSITYNSKTNKLVVTYTSDHLKRMAVINPSTLTLERSFDVNFAEGVDGRFFNSSDNMGFSSISYNPTRNVYVAVTKGTRGFAILDSNFKIKEYIPFSSKDDGYLWQNIDSTDEYITVVKSPMAGSGKKHNLLAIYDWNGRFVTNFNIVDNLEMENMFHIGTKYYLTLYKAYYNEKGTYCRDSYVYTFDLDKENLTLKNCVVIPAKPYKLTLTNGKKQIKVKWTKVTNADGYKVYYKTAKTGGKYKLLKTVTNVNTTSYTHKKLVSGRTYTYKVKAFTKKNGKYYYSPYTSVKSMKAKK